MKYLLRTKISKNIVCEVALPERQTGKVALVCGGAPSLPPSKNVLPFLASQGYVAFGIRYRGTWESEGTFLQKAPTQDVLDVIDYLVKHKKITDAWSGEKIAIKIKHFDLFGGSFGGPAVLLASKHKAVRKVVAMTPVVDFNKDGEGETFEQFVQYATEVFGGVYRPKSHKDWDKLRGNKFYNPITMLDQIDEKKCFVIQTKDDDVCPADNLRNLVALKKIAVYYKPKGGHLGVSSLQKKFYWNKVATFLK
jgi:dipeptidyl aminopeptidase/acylaminoacyl peptidase